MPVDRSTSPFRDFTGVVCALVTPFDDSDAVDVGKLHRLVDFVVEAGVAGIMVGGTTGEFVAMSMEERQLCNREAVVASGGRVPVIAHVGHVQGAEAARLAERAAADGADAVAAITPYYHAVSESAVVSYLRRVAGAVPDVACFAYVFPDAARNSVSAETFGTLLEVPNLVGVKLSVGEMADIEPFLSLPGLCVMSGNDLLMAPFASHGGRAVVSGNATAYPEAVVGLFDSLATGDEAAGRRYRDAVAAAAELSRGGAPDRFKQLLARRGIDAGRARVETFTPSDIDPATEARLLARLEPVLATTPARP